MSDLASFLGLEQEHLDELDIEDKLEENWGSSGEMPYNFYFYVPDNLSEEVIELTGWKAGQMIEVPRSVFDEDERE